MPRLWVGNFDFEYQLGAFPQLQLSRKLQEINHKLLPEMLPLTHPGDYLWLPPGLSPDQRLSLQKACEEAGVTPVEKESQIPAQSPVQLSPWGWTAPLIAWRERHFWKTDAPDFSLIQRANSRQTSFEYEERWQLAPSGSAQFQKLANLESFLSTLSPESGWVIKAEFGMSARERLLGQGSKLSEPQRNWLKKRFERAEPVFFEPWLTRIAESSFHFHIAPTGEVNSLGQLELLTDPLGRYLGNRPLPADASTDWPESRTWTAKLAQEFAHAGYFGPLSIDSMRYLAADGEIRERPLQDINARWTMGRCTWERIQKNGGQSQKTLP